MTHTAAAPPWLINLLTTPTRPTPGTTQISGTFTAPDHGDRPGDKWAETTTWADLLTADGWTLHHTDRNGEHHWTRPGKETRDGTSATTGYLGSDVLKIFTSSMTHQGLRPEETYTKVGYIAATRHDGDFKAAARWCKEQNDGPTPAPTPPAAPVDPGEPWPDPIPLGADTELPPFPLHVLPEWITDQALEVADDIQVPADLPATLALGALATLCATKVKIHVHGRWMEDTNLYLVVAMPPSTGKSPSYKAMVRPVHDLEAEYTRQVRGTVAANADIIESLEGKIKRIRQADTPDPHELVNLREQLFVAMEQPTKPPKLTVGDATPEALEKLIADNGGRMAVHSTEGGVFGTMAGRYSEKTNLDVYLQGWSGDKIDTQRIGREGVSTVSAILTMVLTVQPSVIAGLAQKPELAGRGLTARFMYAMPTDTLGYRDLNFYAEPGPAVADTYHHKMMEIGRRMLSWQNPATLGLDHAAATHFADWRARLEVRRQPHGDLRPMAEWSGKLESSVLRTAALLHVAWGNDIGAPVDLTTIARAIEIGEYWIAHAAHVHDVWGTSEGLADARFILKWLKDEGRTSFTNRDLYGANRRRFTKADSTAEGLQLLTERGWIRVEAAPAEEDGRKTKTTHYGVNPAQAESSARVARAQIVETASYPQESARVARVVPRDIDQDLLTSCISDGMGTHARSARTTSEAPITATEHDPAPSPPIVVDVFDLLEGI
jgi:replicative DNA helicase